MKQDTRMCTVARYVKCSFCACAGPDCAVRASVTLPTDDELIMCSVGSLTGVLQFSSSGLDLSSGISGLVVFSLGRITVYVSDALYCSVT